MTDRVAGPSALASHVNRVVIGAAIALVAAAAVGVWLVIAYVRGERERDLQAWQLRLGIVADSRSAAVRDWVEQQYAVLNGLAENQSLQLDLAELTGGGADEVEARVPREILQILLNATAFSAGFAPPPGEPVVEANVERVGLGGIGLTDATGNLVIASLGMPPPSPGLRQAIAAAAAGERGLADLSLGTGERPLMGFAVPIFAVQDETARIGTVVGLRPVGDDLFDRLRQPGEALSTAETYLVRATGETVEYLSPLADGTKPLRRSLDRTTPELAAGFVIDKPGGFAVKRNYAGTDVLVTGRALPLVPWYLVRTVAAEEALTEIESRSGTLLTVFILIIVLVAAALVAVWRHATSLREAEAAERYRVTAELFTNVTEFLRAVTDNLPNPVFAVDRDSRYIFANMAAATEAGTHPRDMIGKPLSGVLGPARARPLQRLNHQVIIDQEPASEVHRLDVDGAAKVLRSTHLPLPATTLRPAGALVLVDDLTELTAERDRRERTLRQLVQTLVGVVDRRDPFSADHSARVAEVARAIAEEMGLAPVDRATVEIAGSLINLGKILVPRELLTKTADLTEEEREILRQSVQNSAELLERVDFDGPVVESLRQMQERWDGNGPRGIAGDNIVAGARVIAVANAFVGMVSARAYREPMPFNRACSILQDGAGTMFDRRPVSALVNYLDNRGGADKWAHYGERSDPAGDGPVD
ncbi:MAG TPA: HD domain-containing phosphohydrolase [Kiloniellales bacterium]